LERCVPSQNFRSYPSRQTSPITLLPPRKRETITKFNKTIHKRQSAKKSLGLLQPPIVKIHDTFHHNEKPHQMTTPIPDCKQRWAPVRAGASAAEPGRAATGHRGRDRAAKGPRASRSYHETLSLVTPRPRFKKSPTWKS